MPFALIGFFLGLQSGFSAGPKMLDSVDSAGQWNLNRTMGWGWDITNFVWWKGLLFRLVLVILCMVFARSAAMAFNRYLDRD